MHRTKLKYSTLRDHSAVRVDAEGIEIALFKVGGKLYALKNACPHQHFRMLHEGEVLHGAVTCPMHGWTFDLETGATRTGQGKATVYPVHIDNDEIVIDVGS